MNQLRSPASRVTAWRARRAFAPARRAGSMLLFATCVVLLADCRSRDVPQREAAASRRALAPSVGLSTAATRSPASAPVDATRSAVADPAASRPEATRPIAAHTYDLGYRVVPSAPGHRAKLRALVRWPADVRPHERLPIAVLVHGNNGVCRDAAGRDRCGREEATTGVCRPGETATPNAEGFIWLAERLARAGWVAVSVDANSVNCSGLPVVVQGRTRLIVEHLRFWRIWQRDHTAPAALKIVERADLTRVALIGHSNGAEAAVRVPGALSAYAWDPRLHDVRVRAVVAVASSDSTEARPSDASLMHVTAGCDRQMPENDGVRILDRALERRQAAVVQVVFPTASHNGFMSTWGTDENDRPEWIMCPGVRPAAPTASREALAALCLPFLHATVRATPRALPAWLLGDGPPPAQVRAAMPPSLELRIYGAPRRFRLIERHGGMQKVGTGLLGGTIRAQQIAGGPCFADGCSDDSPNVAWGTFVSWKTDRAALSHGLPDLDFSAWKTISVRVGVAPGDPVSAPFALVLRDGNGVAAGVSAKGLRTGQPPPRHARGDAKSFVRPDMQFAVRFPLASFKKVTPTLDLRHIVAVEFFFDAPSAGKKAGLVLGDIELTVP